jgi:hypothetical protein
MLRNTLYCAKVLFLCACQNLAICVASKNGSQ